MANVELPLLSSGEVGDFVGLVVLLVVVVAVLVVVVVVVAVGKMVAVGSVGKEIEGGKGSMLMDGVAVGAADEIVEECSSNKAERRKRVVATTLKPIKLIFIVGGG